MRLHLTSCWMTQITQIGIMRFTISEVKVNFMRAVSWTKALLLWVISDTTIPIIFMRMRHLLNETRRE
jgi:hypothetical protein